MQKQAAKTRVFTQETLTELQDKMHKYAEQEMNEHPEIFEGEDLKEIEEGRNSDWSKEFFVRKKTVGAQKAKRTGTGLGFFLE